MIWCSTAVVVRCPCPQGRPLRTSTGRWRVSRFASRMKPCVPRRTASGPPQRWSAVRHETINVCPCPGLRHEGVFVCLRCILFLWCGCASFFFTVCHRRGKARSNKKQTKYGVGIYWLCARRVKRGTTASQLEFFPLAIELPSKVGQGKTSDGVKK